MKINKRFKFIRFLSFYFIFVLIFCFFSLPASALSSNGVSLTGGMGYLYILECNKQILSGIVYIIFLLTYSISSVKVTISFRE